MSVRRKWLYRLVAVIFTISSTHAASGVDLDPTETSWGTTYIDDGFSKSYLIYKYSTESTYDDFDVASSYNLEIQCEDKDLAVLVYAGPIGIYPSSGLDQIGVAQVKVDSGKINKYKYVVTRDNAGIVIYSPKVLTTALIKGKRQVAFKIPSSIQNDAVAVFKLGNLSSFVSKFKSMGCPLK
jgi:hypothetical protein